MKSKFFTLLVMAAAIIAITALGYQNVHAYQAGWTGNSSWACAYAACRLNCPTGGHWSYDRQCVYGGTATASDACPVGNGLCYAWAQARHVWPWGSQVRLFSYCRVPPRCWGYAKGDTVVIQDTVVVELDSIGDKKYSFRTQGEMKFYPRSAADKTWAHAEVRVYTHGVIDSTDTTNPWPSADRTLFWGKIIIGPGGFFLEGGYASKSSAFHDSLINGTDTLLVSFDVHDTITYDGSPTDSLYLGIRTPDRATNVPTTTQWGVYILMGLIVASGVFIMLRRRKAAVPA